MSVLLVQMLTIRLFSWRIRVRERLAKEHGCQRSLKLGHVIEPPVYHRQFQHQSQMSMHYHTDPPGSPQACPQPDHHTEAQLTRSVLIGGQEVVSFPSYLSIASGPMSRGRQQQSQEAETEGTEDVKTEGLLKSRKAVLPSEIRRRERSTEDPWRGRGDPELGLSRVKTRSQVREGEAEDQAARDRHRGRARWDETEHNSQLQAAENRSREQENACHIHKWGAASNIQPRMAHVDPGSSTSYTAGETRGPSQRNLQHQTHDPQEVRQGEGFSNRECHKDTRVSVAQLRHSYMETTTTPPTSRRNEL